MHNKEKRDEKYNQTDPIYLNSRKVAELLLRKIDEVKRELGNFSRMGEAIKEDDFYYYDGYLKHINTEKIKELASMVKQKETFNFRDLYKLFCSVWDKEVLEEIEESETFDDKPDKEKEEDDEEVIVVPVSKKVWSFYMTYDFVDWEIWTNRKALT